MPTKPAGYSGTPLVTKLGIKDGHRVVVVGPAPVGLGLRASGLGRTKMPIDVAIVFCPMRAVFETELPKVRAKLAESGAIWIAWPKRASGVPTDMTEDVVREVALPTGLVDTKVAAIDATWSGLRLVIRKELR